MSQAYPQTATNSVNRLKYRASYDVDFINDIVNSTTVVHVSFAPDPSDPNTAPAILPMLGQMGQYPSGDSDDTPTCYLHGYVTSRLMKLAADSDSGLPVCVAATKTDGLVLSLTPFSHSVNYRSAALFGRAVVVDDADEKLWALRHITEGVLPGRWDASRTPPDASEMQATRVLRVRVDSASAKTRDGEPGEERKDMKREEVLDRVWTGVVPLAERWGEPVGSSYNRVKETPGYIGEFVERENREAERYVQEAARMEAPGKRKKNKD